MQSNIVGKNFTISKKINGTDVYHNRHIHILGEFIEEGERKYRVQEEGKEPFSAIADVYDKYFDVQKGKVLPKRYNAKLQN